MNKKGTVLFEVVLLLSLLVGGLFAGHLSVIRSWKEQIQMLQQQRLKYDGIIQWEPLNMPSGL